MSINSYTKVLEKCISKNVDLIAVSKTQPMESIDTYYKKGQRDFGENRPLELKEKAENLPTDIRWHMIGPIQTNKIKYFAPFVYLVHSVDRIKVIKEINKQAIKLDRNISILLQLHIAEEEHKHGFNEKEIRALFEQKILSENTRVKVRGLMGMATFTEDSKKIRNEFQRLKSFFDTIKRDYNLGANFEILSMGMSNDYEVAIECGSNMVRVGSLIFKK